MPDLCAALEAPNQVVQKSDERQAAGFSMSDRLVPP